METRELELSKAKEIVESLYNELYYLREKVVDMDWIDPETDGIKLIDSSLSFARHFLDETEKSKSNLLLPDIEKLGVTAFNDQNYDYQKENKSQTFVDGYVEGFAEGSASGETIFDKSVLIECNQQPVASTKEFKRKGSRFTLEELTQNFGLECISVEQYKNGIKIHPIHKKWLELSWIIENVYGFVESEQMSLGKARELTSAIAEHFHQLLLKESDDVEFSEWCSKNNWTFVCPYISGQSSWVKDGRMGHMKSLELYKLYLTETGKSK